MASKKHTSTKTEILSIIKRERENLESLLAGLTDAQLIEPGVEVDWSIKDILVHFTQDMSKYDHALQRENAYASFTNHQCQKCHRNILNIPNKRGAMLAHRDVLYARPGYEKKCVDCHRNLVHMPREVYAYKQYQDTYRGLGL